MKTFKEYMKEKTLNALEREHFDINGNSPVAQYNKPFLKRVGYVTRGTFRDVNYVVKRPILEWSLGDIISLFFVTLLFPLILFVGAIMVKARAVKELKVEYRKSSIDTLHK